MTSTNLPLPGPQRRPRTPAFVQVAASVALAIVLAAVTLTTRQPPPPAIAEFAPQAAEQIKEQPKEQSSPFGSGAGPGDCPPGAACEAGEGGGAGAGGGTPTTTQTSVLAPVVEPASLKRCVGVPPRQIEDPQSPPCIAYWDDSKGNGGATAPGVTKDTITISYVDGIPGGFYQALAKFFNTRFQLYGRQIQLVLTANRAAGADEAKQKNAFAALTSYNDITYYRQLVKNHIIGTYRTNDFSDGELADSAPYLWGYPMSFTQMLSHLADWACHRLAGQAASHAGIIDDQPLSARMRTFGVWLDLGTPDASVRPDVLRDGLRQCGAAVPMTPTYPRFDNDPIRIRTEISRAKAEGITTIFCLCVSTNLVSLQAQAETQRYQPEWIISSYPQLGAGDGYDGVQMDRTFGVEFAPMTRVPEDHPQIWALREADPSNPNAGLRTGVVGSNDIHYRGFLQIAAGLQMAGPNLTPQTFMEGLRRTRFPNPDHPIMAGSVGFAGDFSMVDDGVEFWFSPHDAGPYADAQGGPTFCYVDGGKRHAKGTWPRGGDPFFQGPCDSGNRSVS